MDMDFIELLLMTVALSFCIGSMILGLYYMTYHEVLGRDDSEMFMYYVLGISLAILPGVIFIYIPSLLRFLKSEEDKG
jgi:ABC-type antimicrobial peptide transport system permease subunit